MKNLTEIQDTMSTREIAELTNKRHDHVMRDVKSMLEQLAEGGSPELGNDINQGVTHVPDPERTSFTKEYLLNRQMALTLVSGYNIVLRHRIIQRWEELENHQKSLSNSNAIVIEEMLARLGFVETHFTIVGYGNIHGFSLDRETASRLGHKATPVSNQLGYEIRKVNHPLWGYVNSHHGDVLKIVFAEYTQEKLQSFI